MLLFIFGTLLMVLFLFGQTRSVTPVKSKDSAEIKPSPSPFPWKAVILPLVSLVFVVVIVTFFWGKLPYEVGSRFTDDGVPTSFTTRMALVLWALLPQLFLAGLAFLVAWGINRISPIVRSAQEAGFKLDDLLIIMGNMIALPQLILGFAMLNTFGYNAYQVRMLPLWVVVLIIAVAGAVILGAFFITAIRKMWQKNIK
jgi:uncharacterized membrane protein